MATAERNRRRDDADDYQPGEYDESRDRSADQNARFPEDRLVRRFGFRIAARPTTGPAVWRRDGADYPHAEAVALARADEDAARRRRS